ncbi:MAG: ATP-grasp domain-containing protein [Ruminococcaceae bacterium]|nr:ATP-grasp domain-containing protein [Oscillospiraceae bacterium]
MGYYVGVIDFNPNAVGVSYADVFFNVSTIDIEGVTETAKQFQPDGIVTLATDMPMRAIASATKALGLPGISMETAIRATDKGEMIKAFAAHSVPSPWYFIVENEEKLASIQKKITYPCIMKPLDNSGSRGVMLIERAEKLAESFAYSVAQSRGAGVIVEEYMQGSEVSVEIMVIGGESHILTITDKLTTGAPHFVEMGHSQPSRFDEKTKEAICEVARGAVKAIGLENGPAHAEIMVTKEGPKMVEIGARMGGDCITTHLVPLSTGIDMIGATILLACGKVPDVAPKTAKGAAIRYFTTDSGVLESISGAEAAAAIPGVQEITFVKEPGEAVGDIGSSTDRVGFVIAQGETAEEAIGICEKAIDMVTITIK